METSKERLSRRLALAKQAVNVNASLKAKLACWRMVQESAIDANDDKAFDLANKWIEFFELAAKSS